MSDTLIYTIVGIYCVMCGVCCGMLADDRNRHPIGWFVFGVIGNVVALLTVGMLSKQSDDCRFEWDRE